MRRLSVVLALILSACSGSSPGPLAGGTGPADTSTATCQEPLQAWIRTLESAFIGEHEGAAIEESAYVEAETSEGTAYYVAVRVDGVSGVAVFGTSDAPTQADPGLIAVANDAASELSDL